MQDEPSRTIIRADQSSCGFEEGEVGGAAMELERGGEDVAGL